MLSMSNKSRIKAYERLDHLHWITHSFPRKKPLARDWPNNFKSLIIHNSLHKVSLNGIKQSSLRFPERTAPFHPTPWLKLRLIICFQEKGKREICLEWLSETLESNAVPDSFCATMTHFIYLSEDLVWGQAGLSGLNDHVGTSTQRGDSGVGRGRTQSTFTTPGATFLPGMTAGAGLCALQAGFQPSTWWLRPTFHPLGFLPSFLP